MADTRDLTDDEEVEALEAVAHTEDIADDTVFLLPDRIEDGGNNYLYRDDVAGLVKIIRASGCDLRFGAPARKRLYLSEYGAADEILIPITLGVIGNLSTDLVKSIYFIVSARLQRAVGIDDSSEGRISLRVAEIELTPNKRVIRGLAASGSPEEIRKTLETLLKEGAA